MFPFLKDGRKSGKHDSTPCNDESMRNRVTFKCSFSFPGKSVLLGNQKALNLTYAKQKDLFASIKNFFEIFKSVNYIADSSFKKNGSEEKMANSCTNK